MPRWPDPDTESRRLYDRALQVFPGGVTRVAPWQPPSDLRRAARVPDHDVDGNRYLDVINNYASLIHGHAHPAIEAVRCSCRTARPAACRRTPRSRSAGSSANGAGRSTGSASQFGNRSSHDGGQGGAGVHRRPALAKFEGAYHGAYDFVEVSLASSPENWGNASHLAMAYCRGTPQSVLDEMVVLPFNQLEAARTLCGATVPGLRPCSSTSMPIKHRVGSRHAGIPEPRSGRVSHAVGALDHPDEVISFRIGYRGAQGAFGSSRI